MSGIERLGTQMADRLLGTAESDILVGHGGDDRLSGDGGNDQLIGGMGRDHMAGGAGYDRFFYRHSREGGDRIVDFSVLSDWFVISASGFNGLRSGGILERDQFCRGEVALDRRDRFIYSPQTGMLSFDADGSGIGQSVEIARLPRTLALAHHHFYLVD
jgi:Ca2+-binding RTX toxin-like protein